MSYSYVVQALCTLRRLTTWARTWRMATTIRLYTLLAPTSTSGHFPVTKITAQPVSLDIMEITSPPSGLKTENAGSGKYANYVLHNRWKEIREQSCFELVPRGFVCHFSSSCLVKMYSLKWGTWRKHSSKSAQVFSRKWWYFQISKLQHWL